VKKYLHILQYAEGFRSKIILNIFFNLLSSLSSLFLLLLLNPFLKLLFLDERISPQSDPMDASTFFPVNSFIDYFKLLVGDGSMTGKGKALVFLCVMIMLFSFGRSFFQYLALYIMIPVRQGVVRNLRNRIYDKIMTLPISYFSDKKKGDIITRSTSDVGEIEVGILNTIEVTTRDPFMIAIFVTTLLLHSVKLTLFVILMLGIVGLLIGNIGKTLKKSSNEGQERLGVLMSIIEESLNGLKIIKGFVAEHIMKFRFRSINQRYNETIIGINRTRELASPLTEFLAVSVLAAVLWYGGRLVLSHNETLTAAGFITYIALFSQLIQPAKNFSKAYYLIQKGFASVERVEEILHADNIIKDVKNPISKTSFETNISFRNVSFQYNKGRKILDNISFEVVKGKTIAIVGQSGAGKSTVVDLLPRFYDIEHGEILIDGINIKNILLHDLRSMIGIVTQEAILFNDTLKNNITLGIDNINDAQIIQACKMANAHDFIMQKSNGYNTNVGDKGHQLSGGERQRITIARALLKNPQILILDEATSALDAESEKLVQEALYKLLEGRTSLVIAHRLATIQHADEILVMHEGNIIERGTHQSLMSLGQHYAKLVALQSL